MTEQYLNAHGHCSCSMCEIQNICAQRDRFQRLPRGQAGTGGLGLCPKLKPKFYFFRNHRTIFPAGHVVVFADDSRQAIRKYLERYPSETGRLPTDLNAVSEFEWSAFPDDAEIKASCMGIVY